MLRCKGNRFPELSLPLFILADRKISSSGIVHSLYHNLHAEIRDGQSQTNGLHSTELPGGGLAALQPRVDSRRTWTAIWRNVSAAHCCWATNSNGLYKNRLGCLLASSLSSPHHILPFLASQLQFLAVLSSNFTHLPNMVQLLQAFGLVLSTASILVSASPMPVPTAAPDLTNAAALHKRTSCTFTAASAASKSKASCATIVLDGITVPSGTTLDLTGLTSGTSASIREPHLFTLTNNNRLSSREPRLGSMRLGAGHYFQSQEPTSRFLVLPAMS